MVTSASGKRMTNAERLRRGLPLTTPVLKKAKREGQRGGVSCTPTTMTVFETDTVIVL